MTLKGQDGKYTDIDGATCMLDVARMMDVACVLRPVFVGAGAGIEEDDRGEAGVDVGGAGGTGESAMGEADRVLDSAGGV